MDPSPLLANETTGKGISELPGVKCPDFNERTRYALIALHLITVIAFLPGLYKEFLDPETKGTVWEADCNCVHGQPLEVGEINVEFLSPCLGVLIPKQNSEGNHSIKDFSAGDDVKLFNSKSNPYLVYWLHILLLVPWCISVLVTFLSGGIAKPFLRLVHKYSAWVSWILVASGMWVIVLRGGFLGYTMMLAALGSGQLLAGIVIGFLMRKGRER